MRLSTLLVSAVSFIRFVSRRRRLPRAVPGIVLALGLLLAGWGAPLGASQDATTPVAATASGAGVMVITGDAELLDGPAGVAVDAAGTLYVVDGRHDRIRIFDPAGKQIGAWGESGDGPGQFNFHGGDAGDRPYGDLAVAADGSVYVADSYNHRIQKLGPDGSFLLAWGELGTEDGQFTDPSGLALDPQGNVYVADYTNARIQVFTGGGEHLATWDGNGEGQSEYAGPLYGPNDVAVDAEGFAWVTDDQNNRLYRFDADGALVGGFGVRGTAFDQVWAPWGIAIDAAGTVYVAEEHNHRIHVLSPEGATIGLIGGQGAAPGMMAARGSEPGQFNAPLYVAAGADGALAVADQDNNRVQVFSPPLPLATPTP